MCKKTEKMGNIKKLLVHLQISGNFNCIQDRPALDKTKYEKFINMERASGNHCNFILSGF